MTHGIVQELEQRVVRCECGQVFSSKFAAGLMPRRSARAAFRRHIEEVPS